MNSAIEKPTIFFRKTTPVVAFVFDPTKTYPPAIQDRISIDAGHVITIDTASGKAEIGKPGDYILIDAEGFPYPCKKEIFESTYVSVDELLKEFKPISNAIKFIYSEYNGMNDDGDIIPDPTARRVYEDLITFLFGVLRNTSVLKNAPYIDCEEFQQELETQLVYG